MLQVMLICTVCDEVTDHAAGSVRMHPHIAPINRTMSLEMHEYVLHHLQSSQIIQL